MMFVNFSMPRLSRICILIFLIIFTGCAKRVSILDISDEDLQHINEILVRPSEEVRFFPAYDNVPLACTVIRPETPIKGAVLFIHGLGARSNVYLPLADELAENGYIVYLFDIRGHGYSHGSKGHMPSYDTMAKDIRHFYEYVLSIEGESRKYIAMGHSLGTYVWVNTLSSYEDIEIDALVLISGGSINSVDNISTVKEHGRYFSYISKWKAFLSIFNHNIKPVHIVFPDIPHLAKSGFVQDYGFSFFSMFHDYKNRFETFYTGTNIPIFMISGRADEIFKPKKLDETYNLINSNNKKLIILEGNTHTSIIWSAGIHINSLLEDYFSNSVYD